jgi:hypothetical protein
MQTQNFWASEQENAEFGGWQVLALKPDMSAFWANSEIFVN